VVVILIVTKQQKKKKKLKHVVGTSTVKMKNTDGQASAFYCKYALIVMRRTTQRQKKNI